MKIAVLGCGPAGLLATHAAVRAGHEVEVFSKKTKSPLYGAQYLHREIPGIATGFAQPVKVRYELQGSVEGYRSKVYGDVWDGTVSPETFGTPHLAWDIRWAYDCLWATYSGLIQEAHITSLWMDHGLPRGYDLIINSIPRKNLCSDDRHKFVSRMIWAMGDAPGIQSVDLDVECNDNTVLCSGVSADRWYRLSNIYGFRTVEWPGMGRPSPRASRVHKPLENSCDCWPSTYVTHVGRYGEWKKGVLTHHAYEKIEAMLGV